MQSATHGGGCATPCVCTMGVQGVHAAVRGVGARLLHEGRAARGGTRAKARHEGRAVGARPSHGECANSACLCKGGLRQRGCKRWWREPCTCEQSCKALARGRAPHLRPWGGRGCGCGGVGAPFPWQPPAPALHTRVLTCACAQARALLARGATPEPLGTRVSEGGGGHIRGQVSDRGGRRGVQGRARV